MMYILWYMVHAAFGGSPPARLDDRADRFCYSNRLSPVKPFCLKPSEAPRQSPLLGFNAICEMCFDSTTPIFVKVVVITLQQTYTQ